MKDILKYVIAAILIVAIGLLVFHLSGCGKTAAPVPVVSQQVIVSPALIKDSANKMQADLKAKCDSFQKADSALKIAYASLQKRLVKDKKTGDTLAVAIKTDTGFNRQNVDAYIDNADQTKSDCDSSIINLSNQVSDRDKLIASYKSSNDSLHASLLMVAAQDSITLQNNTTLNAVNVDQQSQLQSKDKQIKFWKWCIPVAVIASKIFLK